MPKDIALCLDRTGNQLNAKGNTNVLGLLELLDCADPSCRLVRRFSNKEAWVEDLVQQGSR